MIPLSYQLDWDAVLTHRDELIRGAWVDVYGAAVGFVLACGVGLFVALLRTSGVSLLLLPSFIYVQVLRGVPLYVFLVWVYFGVATVTGVAFTNVQAMIITLALTGSAYTAEIFRAGLGAIDRGHFEAARSLGLGRVDTYRSVILPQVLRIVVPPLGNTLVGLLKGATIVSVIGVRDMVFIAQDINVTYFTPFEAFAAVGVILVLLVFLLSGVIYGVERQLRIP